MNYELLEFGSAPELAQAAAQRWIGQWPESPGDPYLVALFGGRISKAFYQAAANEIRKQGVDTSSIHFFWGDERCVPPTDPDSNYLTAAEFLLTPLQIPAAQIHRIHGETEPTFGAAEAEAELCRLAPLNSTGEPVLDLVFLGMGEDGHVASLFPGDAHASSSAVYRPITASKPPPQRITISYGAILSAREVWILASGSGKEEALVRSLDPAGDTPLARVLKGRESTVILTDIVRAKAR